MEKYILKKINRLIDFGTNKDTSCPQRGRGASFKF